MLDATDLSLLLSGIDLRSAKRRKRYALPAPAGTYPADFVQPGRSFFLNVAQEF